LKSVFDKLNLRPGERRLVIIVMIVVFIVLNFIFVWPHFGDWGKIKARRTIAENLIRQYQREIANTPLYQAQLKDLEKQGATVQSEAQALTLSTEVQNQAALSGVQVNRYDPVRQTAVSIGGKTNQFFEEQSGIINVTTEEKSLVDFLFNLGNGRSLIRVRSFTLNPDPPRHKLQGNVTLVASYQKKAPPKVAPPVAPPPAARSTNPPGRSASPFPAAPTNAAVKSKAPAAATATNTTAAKTNQSVLDRMKGWFK
jgi:Tfp pilus assembly protein PilO